MRMRHQAEESIAPFRLVKYFSLTSLVVILIPTLLLSIFITQRAKNELLRKSEQYALLVAINLNHQVFTQFVLPTVLQLGRVQLSNPRQYERLDQIIRNTIHGFKIDRVDVYDLNELVTYSTDLSLVGLPGSGGIDYKLARQGKSSSRLVSRGSFLGFELGAVAKQRQLKTFIPLRMERPLSRSGGRILGVFEITQDISEDYAAITRFQNIIIVSFVAMMILLFFVLRLIVKRAEGIIAKRAEERRRLEEALHQSEAFQEIQVSRDHLRETPRQGQERGVPGNVDGEHRERLGIPRLLGELGFPSQRVARPGVCPRRGRFPGPCC